METRCIWYQIAQKTLDDKNSSNYTNFFQEYFDVITDQKPEVFAEKDHEKSIQIDRC